ncbi:MAG: twin-arginine translocase TatA/TatE family subunit [Candidatus Nanoarchaeia archaeon]|nr:twin-arginine translocase TatA/TatE family subunit [Candidatus Nanoarchaeia archaeon]
MIGAGEIILILLLAVFLFGGPKVVEWAREAGRAKRVFNEELKKEDEVEENNSSKEEK